MTNTDRSDDMTMLVRFNRHIHIRLGEWLAGAILISIGLVLFGFPRMFDGPEHVTYSYLRSIAPQVVWAFGFTLTGLVRLVALYINGRKSITPYIRMAMAFISCFLWYQFSLGFVLSGVATTGLAVYPWLLSLDIYNVFRSSADAREVYDKKRGAPDNGTIAS